jgi:hypothetical protein
VPSVLLLHDVSNFCLPFNSDYSSSLNFPPVIAARRQIWLDQDFRERGLRLG